MKAEHKLGIIFVIIILLFYFFPVEARTEVVDTEYLNWFMDRCAVYDMPLEIVLAVAIVESNITMIESFPNQNGSIDIGIMQINSRYIKYFEETFWYTDKSFDVYNSEQNIEMGILILQNLYQQTNSWDKTVRAYNTGLYATKHDPNRSHEYLIKVINVLNTLRLRKN